MGLIERVKSDVARITTSLNGFGVTMLLTAPNTQTVTITGFHTKHHLGIDLEGRPVNSKSASISFSEIALLVLNPNYPTRNTISGEVDLKGHRVVVKDSTGSNKNFIINQWFPDEVTGLIVCILGDYE